MKVKKVILSGIVLAMSQLAMAGGILTNTNQNIAFLRNPARDAAIGIDGVYSNPAGVAFLNDGFHLSLNWQTAVQTRTVWTTNPNYALNVNDPSTTKKFKGDAFVPVLPSVQAAYNKGPWSFQFNFAVHGGGGRCEFSDGLGSFENAVANIAQTLVGQTNTIYGGLGQMGQAFAPLAAYGLNFQNISPITGYSFDQYMEGKQYYFGFTLGAAYKVTDNFSVYGGLRFLYGTATYKAKLENIQVQNAAGDMKGLKPYFADVQSALVNDMSIVETAKGMGIDVSAAEAGLAMIAGGLADKTQLLDQYADGVNLQSDQSAFGFAPIIGADYRTGNFNFAVKYEFKACMMMKNKSTVDKVSAIPAVNKFLDGTKVHEDSPSMLSLGAEWKFLPQARLNLGYHHFFDKDSKKYNDEQKLLDGDTNEFLGGLEYDVNKKLTASAGLQITRYGLSDEYMNDMSFVVNSWSYGLGVKYKFSDKVALNAGYFKTKYETYDRVTPAQPQATPAPTPETKDSFTRSNRVFGVGVDLTF